ncbi:unnamed protein product [Brachionus calyciflorus]|uniref:Target of rapamycin complex subunit lst8 n=1 Tax=Brachionus calyciflorus TaxID=104777 RepID=A0A814QCP1_9BILA|nr:unnamed protein product [Brachionus calyciflorus]
MTTLTNKTKLTGHQECVTRLSTLTNGDLASASNDRTVRIWNTRTYTFLKSINTNADPISINNLPNGNLMTGHSTGIINLWNVSNNSLIKSLNSQRSSRINFLLALPQGEIAAADSSGNLIIWNKNI